jgi:hypothetical protein
MESTKEKTLRAWTSRILYVLPVEIVINIKQKFHKNLRRTPRVAFGSSPASSDDGDADGRNNKLTAYHLIAIADVHFVFPNFQSSFKASVRNLSIEVLYVTIIDTLVSICHCLKSAANDATGNGILLCSNCQLCCMLNSESSVVTLFRMEHIPTQQPTIAPFHQCYSWSTCHHCFKN